MDERALHRLCTGVGALAPRMSPACSSECPDGDGCRRTHSAQRAHAHSAQCTPPRQRVWDSAAHWVHHLDGHQVLLSRWCSGLPLPCTGPRRLVAGMLLVGGLRMHACTAQGTRLKGRAGQGTPQFTVHGAHGTHAAQVAVRRLACRAAALFDVLFNGMSPCGSGRRSGLLVLLAGGGLGLALLR